MTGVIDMLHYTFFPQDQKTLERLLSQLIAADGIHLTMGGYEQLFDTLADWVKHNI